MTSDTLLMESVPDSESEMVCQFISENGPRTTCSDNAEEMSYDSSIAKDDAVVANKSAALSIDVKATPDGAPPASTATIERIEEEESEELQVGDHVYQWRRLLGIPWVFQHHGIVMDIIKDSQGKTAKLTIADFSNVETKQKTKYTKNATKHNEQSSPSESADENDDSNQQCSSATATTSSSRRIGLTQEGILRAYTDTDEWHKVHYEASWWKRQVYRSGTTTKAKSDPVGLVLARVNFILQHPELLPDYHVVYANCECVAFWCKTGNWSTLQASSFLELTAAGQIKSSATLAAAATGATSTVTVPSAGLWGWLGYTSTAQVSWLSLHPMAIPGLACYSVVSIGVPSMVYVSARKQWKETSKRLCDAFWESATENPEVFAECITHWSEKGL